jgi:histone deacetylase complex subunit SAP30
VLTNGDQVKLQRNALSVIEVATGQEEEEEEINDDIQENLFFSGNSLGLSTAYLPDSLFQAPLL